MKVKQARIKISEIMTSPVITVNIHDTANTIATLMATKKIGSVVVLDDQTSPIGIITERDVVRRIFSKNRKPSEIMARDFMSTPLRTIDPNATITEAAQKMHDLGVRRLIIVNNSKLIGIITSNDVIRIMPKLITVISEKLSENFPEAFEHLWKEISQVSQKKGISKKIILDVLRLTYDCALKEEEGRPTSTGFIIGNPSEILKILSKTGQIKFTRQYIQEKGMCNYITSLFGIIDGLSSSFLIDKKGYLTDIGLFWPIPQTNINSAHLIAPRYTPYAYITETIQDSVAIFSFGKLRVVKFFEEGDLKAEATFSWKNGKWMFRSYKQIIRKLKDLANEKTIDENVLYKCFSLAIEMSNRRRGGSFIIGDYKKVLSQSEVPLFSFKNANLLDFKSENEEYIINLVSKDFATIVDAQGKIVASSTRLLAHPPSNLIVDVTSEDGGRHRSAAEMSAVVFQCVAIVISEDGPITIYSKGKRIIRL